MRTYAPLTLLLLALLAACETRPPRKPAEKPSGKAVLQARGTAQDTFAFAIDKKYMTEAGQVLDCAGKGSLAAFLDHRDAVDGDGNRIIDPDLDIPLDQLWRVSFATYRPCAGSGSPAPAGDVWIAPTAITIHNPRPQPKVFAFEGLENSGSGCPDPRSTSITGSETAGASLAILMPGLDIALAEAGAKAEKQCQTRVRLRVFVTTRVRRISGMTNFRVRLGEGGSARVARTLRFTGLSAQEESRTFTAGHDDTEIVPIDAALPDEGFCKGEVELVLEQEVAPTGETTAEAMGVESFATEYTLHTEPCPS